MIVTEFLAEEDYYKYGEWLRNQDDETRWMFFGVSAGTNLIESLITRIEADPSKHKFLVARNCDGWLGTVHIAEVPRNSVEFGIIVDRKLRGEGIGNMLIDEALVWARNRGYHELFMHCLDRNTVIKHLCQKHGLETCNMFGDSEVKMQLPPPSFVSVGKEISIKNRNVFHTFLQTGQKIYQEIYG